MRTSRRHRFALAAFAAFAVAAAGALAAGAAAIMRVTRAETRIGAVRLEHRPGTMSIARTPALLVPVRYPLHMAGRPAIVRVELLGAHSVLKRASATARLSAGLQRRPDRRRAFRFVHRVPLGEWATPNLAAVRRVRVRVIGRLDVDGDGRAEARSVDVSIQRVRRLDGTPPRPTCASVPVVRVRPRQAVKVGLPVCDTPVRWSIGVRPRHGKVRRAGGWVTYRPGRGHRGLDELLLRGRPAGPRRARGRSAAAPAVTAEVQLYVGPEATAGLKVRALGDSVTAGFGYYADGSPMSFESLLDCHPAASSYNDACSSNSLTTNSSRGGLSFAPDYGLSNNVSWAAQWANAHGITNYANVAVSGSAPGDWIPGGSLYSLTQGVEDDDPDYVVLTLGANPLLSEVLFGIDTMRCWLEPDLFGKFTQCVLNAFASVGLQRNLAAIYQELVAKTDATILLMQYHLSIPSIALAYSAVQLERIGDLLNDAIASVAQSLGSSRLRVVTPPRFSVGIDMTPLAPNAYSCRRLGVLVHVDGASVQAKTTQDELLVDHFSFCSGTAGGSPPWVIWQDTGIHPSATGYAQMASALPAP
jgi:lysophospholipase L1-like esterase